MSQHVSDAIVGTPIDPGLRALCGIAAFYRIAADPAHLQRELALSGREAGVTDLMRASGIVGLKARRVARSTEKQLAATPTPAIAKLREGGFVVFGGRLPDGRFRLVDPVTSIDRAVSAEEFLAAVEPEILLVGRRAGGAGYDPKSFGFRWFLPSIWRYRRPLMHVLLASLFVQVFALVTPLFFQVVVDKVLSHKGYSTLIVLTVGIVLVGLFDVVLQYLRTYALTHTTNRIDVELGQRLFRHLLHLPLSYFETRAAGQTVARVRELENVRAFLTGQGLFSALDLVFTVVFIAVLFAYSWKLTIIVVLSIPLYMLVALGFRPILQEMVREKFNASAVEPAVPGRGRGGHPDRQGLGGRAHHAAAVGGAPRLLRQAVLLGDDPVRHRAERRHLHQPPHHGAADAVRRQGGDRRRTVASARSSPST